MPRPDSSRYCADREHHWRRSSIAPGSRTDCSSCKSRYSYSRSRRHPRTGPTRIRWNQGRAAHSSACRRSPWSRRSWFVTHTGVRPGSPSRSRSSEHTRRWCKGRASSPPVGNPGKSPRRRRSAACSPPSPRKRTSRTRCFPGRACTRQSRRTARCCRRWCDQRPGTSGRAGPPRRTCSGPPSPSGCT